jgi:hypothetical protein
MIFSIKEIHIMALSSRQENIDEASAFYQSAIQCHKKVNDTLHLGNDYRGLGQIYLDWNGVMITRRKTLDSAVMTTWAEK